MSQENRKYYPEKISSKQSSNCWLNPGQMSCPHGLFPLFHTSDSLKSILEEEKIPPKNLEALRNKTKSLPFGVMSHFYT